MKNVHPRFAYSCSDTGAWGTLLMFTAIIEDDQCRNAAVRQLPAPAYMQVVEA